MSSEKSSCAWQATLAILNRLQDLADWHNLRQSAIEDRLAALDGGADAARARRQARSQLVQNRVAASEPPDLHFELRE
jgi:hypothetical protein